MNLVVLVSLTTIGWAFYHIFIKLTGGKIYPALGYVVLSFTAFGAGSLFLLYLKYAQNAALYVTKPGLIFAALAGLMVVLSEMCFFFIFSDSSARLSIFVPIMAAGSVALVAIAGAVFLGEAMTWRSVLGICFALVSVVLLSKP